VLRGLGTCRFRHDSSACSRALATRASPGSDMTRLTSADRDHADELASPHPRLGRLGFTTEVREWAKARGIEVKTADECPLNWWSNPKRRPESRCVGNLPRLVKAAAGTHADERMVAKK
jgi:hypothetical protein